MPLYVIRPPTPTVGTDWAATVPGQYIYDIVGITATLDTGGPTPTVALDASGNGHDGTYHAVGGAQIVPGILPAGGDGALDCSGGTSGASQRARVELPDVMVDFTQDWSIEWWWKTPTRVGAIFNANAPGAVEGLTIAVADVGGGNYQMIVTVDSAGDQWISDTFPKDVGNPHHGVVTYTDPDITMFVDGVALTVATVGPAVEGFVPESNTIATVNGVTNACWSILDEFAIYDVWLPPAVVAAHYTVASVSFAAYSAAILADAPFSYYHLDDVGGGDRQVTLAVTDGTYIVEEIPTGFAESTFTGPFGYSWQPKLPSSSQSADGTTNTVAIPRLILPAGYTVGSYTLDLAPSDQWSAINIWWDSTLMDSENHLFDYRFAPGWKMDYHYDPAAAG